jgi:ribosomal protein S19E (S16A)
MEATTPRISDPQPPAASGLAPSAASRRDWLYCRIAALMRRSYRPAGLDAGAEKRLAAYTAEYEALSAKLAAAEATA